jgi:hypothetical protein
MKGGKPVGSNRVAHACIALLSGAEGASMKETKSDGCWGLLEFEKVIPMSRSLIPCRERYMRPSEME